MKSSKGYTIIELVIVMAVFLFIIGAAISIFLTMIQSQKKILAENQLLNQISYAEEYMSKALRMSKAETAENCLYYKNLAGTQLGNDNPGWTYLLTRQNGNIYQGIEFVNNSNNQCQEFFLDSAGNLKEKTGSNPEVILIPNTLKINYIRFSINGGDGTYPGQNAMNSKQCSSPNQCGFQSNLTTYNTTNLSTIQPRVTILMSIKVPDDQEPNRIIQTTISQRNLNAQQ